MFLLRKFGLLGIVWLLASCSTASFPDFSDETPGSISAGEGLSSDKNISEGSVVAEDPDLNEEKYKNDGKEVKVADEKDKALADKILSEQEELRRRTKAGVYAEDKDDNIPEYLDDEEFIASVEKVSPAQTTPVKTESLKEGKKDDKQLLTADFTTPKSSGDKKTPEADAASKSQSGAETFEPSVTYRLDTFYFANGSSFIDNDYQSRIKEIVHIVKQNNGRIRVLGHASSRTRDTDIVTHKLANFKVSQARAEAVAKALRRAGLPASRISVEALSDSAPAYLEVMPEGERLNRRAEVYISY